jgi:hypothetical protein
MSPLEKQLLAQWIADVLLLLALVAAVWYAWETRKMRLQMIRPKLVFLLAPHPLRNMDEPQAVELFVRNVGDGAALNISIERSQDKNFKLRFEPEHLAILQKDAQVPVMMKPVEGSYQPNMTLILDDDAISLKMVARYVDIEGREFRSSTTVGGGAKPPFIRDERV